ncbi:EB module family protein [Aphelenchoides avenae]|nr:EB module family protein [Aphelenchus avenae]
MSTPRIIILNSRLEKLIGSRCLYDEECYGTNAVCREGRCSCPTNFEEFDIDEKKTVCRLAPSKIGDSCQRDCKPPLLCRDGKCECWGGSIIKGKCTVPCPPGQQLYGVECTRVARLGQTCEKDSHCVDPFNSCIAGTCQCSPGTTKDPAHNKCFAVCPDGMFPRQSCRRLFLNDADMLDNAATTDSCPLGFRCATYGSPYIGHCCRLRCPYGEPDLAQSCDAGAPEDQKCRPLTHFCFSISEPGWKTSLCCPKPCRDPTPLYVNGQCLSIAHREDPCQTDQQCEGGVTMGCLLGTCDCRPGYKKVNDDRFPTCEKECPSGQIAEIDRCVPMVPLDGRCSSSKQCGQAAECRFGLCQCQCNYVQSTSIIGTRCTNPDDPLNINRIWDNVEQLFGSRAHGATY